MNPRKMFRFEVKCLNEKCGYSYCFNTSGYLHKGDILEIDKKCYKCPMCKSKARYGHKTEVEIIKLGEVFNDKTGSKQIASETTK